MKVIPMTDTKHNHKPNECETFPEPHLFDVISTPEIAPKLLPEPYCSFVRELSNATETPPEMAIACVFAMLSIAVTGKYAVSPKKGWVESLNSYWFVEMPPANSKTKVVKEAASPLHLWEKNKMKEYAPIIERIESENKTKYLHAQKLRNKAANPETETVEREKLQKQIEAVEDSIQPVPAYPRLYANNVTPESLENYTQEQGGVFAVVSDEGGVMETLTGLYSNGKANVDILLKGIDGGFMRVRRKDREYSLSPYLTMLLCVQPVVRKKMAKNSSLEGNGALERFLYLIPKSKLGRRTHDKPPLSDATKEAYQNALTALLDIPRIESENGGNFTHIIRLSSEAQGLLHRYQLELEPDLIEGGALYSLQGWGGKIVGFTARIAGLLHLAGGANEHSDIQAETMHNALAISRALLSHAKTTYRLMGMDETERNSRAIYEYLLRERITNIDRSDLVKAMRHTMKAEALTNAVMELEGRHILYEHSKPSTGTRAITFYIVNPHIFHETSTGSSEYTET